ncbi:MAG: chemotaxis-specific protein-glutamate methyltransferase CheB [Ancalomicrobiaceae bacterium]|nr:chemotaxis-specific protein-glutamate methyltransferase CheB [Ancalomicrobiaceae bacterium]
MINVLIVDDSALMRKHLRDLLDAESDIRTRSVRNGVEALLALSEETFDVVTLDLNMPEMDGMTCLSHIMVTNPKPVVMVSSLTENGAEVTLQALSLGAVDYILKPGGTISLSIERIRQELLSKIRAAASVRMRRIDAAEARSGGDPARLARRARLSQSSASRQIRAKVPEQLGLVLVGVSTGGPSTLETILPRLPADFPWAVLVAQHMPSSFTGVFARRLDGLCSLPVIELERQMPIESGTIYIARGDADLVVTRRGTGWSGTPVPSDRDHLWHPSVDRLVTSALDVVPATRLIGVQLTGMGDDGAAAMATLHARGGLTIAQDEATSIVFGMPQELIQRGGASVVLPSDKIANQLNSWLKRAETPTGRRRDAG